MSEIQSVAPIFQVAKPRKISGDENSLKKQQKRKKEATKEQDARPSQHIDVIV